MMHQNAKIEEAIRLSIGEIQLEGELAIPKNAKGIVLFAHGSGSSRFSPRNRFVAKFLRDHQLGTLLIDLLTPDEEIIDEQTRELRFDITMLAERLEGITDWLVAEPRTKNLKIGYFGASTGGAAALIAAANRKSAVSAVVSRGGRPDLAAQYLSEVKAPTLLIVGGHDPVVLELNEQAYAQLSCEKRLAVVPGATHLFEEPGTLEQVANLACAWFAVHCGA